ncbi:hypothetical protein LCGC14_1150380 [marine sediment metagenome]|uniref:Uncharacterized protein n=1 Tax=marine sediment metagenome TaxID=412755 RepID=A0A0F9MIX1_9ZZZZ
MTTALDSLQVSLGVLIGDSNDTYSSNYTKAINNASAEIPDVLFIPLDNMDLITGNILPPFNWANSSTLDFYTEPTGTLAKNTDGAYIWKGSSSASLLASGNNDKLYLSSNDYPRLLDVMNKSVDLKCWVYPVDSAADAFLKIKTWQADGTTQELDSTTTAYAGKKNLIEMESQSINDDLSLVEIWLRVATTAQTVYFDMPRLTGTTVREYLLPKDFQDGYLSRVELQTWGDVDDLHSPNWQPVYDTDIITDGNNKYLQMPVGTITERRIRLIGYKPLEQLSDSSDTISIDAEQVNLLLSYAAFKLFEMESQEIQYTIDGYTDDITTLDTSIDTVQTVIDTAVTAVATVASEDISRYEAAIARNQGQIDRLEAKRNRVAQKRSASERVMSKLKERSIEWLGKYYRLLPSLRMTRPTVTMKVGF